MLWETTRYFNLFYKVDLAKVDVSCMYVGYEEVDSQYAFDILCISSYSWVKCFKHVNYVGGMREL